MKLAIKASMLLLSMMTAVSAMAQEVTQEQKDGTALRVSDCVVKKAPADWSSILTAFDRTDPAKPVLYNVAYFADKSKTPVDIDVSGCDNKKQAEDLLLFRAVVPLSQANWKVLFFTVNKQNQYSVFTDLAIPKQAAKK